MKSVLHTLNSLVLVGVLFFAHAALTVHHFDHHSHAGHAHQHDASSSEDDCPVCDFDFAAFAPFGQITATPPALVWLRSNNDHVSSFTVQAVSTTNFLRGPPELM